MKKLLFLFVLITLAFSLAACELPLDFLNPGTSDGSGSELPEKPEDSEEPAAPVCEHEFVEIGRTEAKPLSDGVIISKCGLCNEEKTEIHTPMTRQLKVLAIGNSFSVDAITYLWNICNNAGVTDLVIANAQIGGCSIDMHFSYMINKTPKYQYTKYTKKGSESKTDVKIDVALEDEDWDFIVTQQLSQYAGKPSTFQYFDNLLEYVVNKCPEAEIYWHMTWAYQEGITKSGYEYYNNDQMTMYNAIVETVQTTVLSRSVIKGVIPAGTAMQNLRTTPIGDNVTRDGYHADLGVGRFAISMTWYAIFTGGSLDLVNWYPGNYYNEVVTNRAFIMESVENAIKTPYSVTQSQYVFSPTN